VIVNKANIEIVKRKNVDVNEIEISDWLWLKNLVYFIIYLLHTISYTYLIYCVC